MFKKVSPVDISIFGMLSAILYVQKLILAPVPNVNLSTVLIIAYTVVFGAKALYTIYIYVILEGIFGGFNVYWLPYLYVWLILWAVVMLIRGHVSGKTAVIVYMLVAGIYGLLYGSLFAPVIALTMGLGWQGMIDWIIAGLPYDLIHGISNFCLGILIMPIVNVLTKLKNNSGL